MTAQIWECDNSTYHADCSRVGASMLKVALESPAKYHAKYVAKTITEEPSKDFILGSLVHCLVLEPENKDKLFCCRPDGINARTNEGKAQLAKWELANLGKQLIDGDLLAKAKAMSEAVLANPVVQDILDGSVREQAITWEEDGLTLKCKPDIYHPDTDLANAFFMDLKTSADPYPEEWTSDSSFAPMSKFRYDLQIAHYSAGIEALTGSPCTSGLIVVGKSEPYDVFVYRCDAYRLCGEAWRQRAFAAIRECREAGIWRRPEQDKVTILPSPREWNFPH